MAGGAIIRVAQPCGCVQESFMGQARDKRCSCGHVFEKAAVVEARRKRNQERASRSKPSTGRMGTPASGAQREKVKGLVCVGCGREEGGLWTIDAAHVWPRSKGGCDHPDCVWPLCRYEPDGSGCHDLFDTGKLDLLPRLAGTEGWAVELAHPILVHGVSPVELVRRLAGNERELVWVERRAA